MKTDMESRKPMDRLICGDVGYGKTEVAIRAAFKAVMDGMQVAVLCPTTVLAEQHWNTFRERMAGFPITVEMLSRFRTPREQKKVVKLLGAGGVDIVIGTHRLLVRRHPVQEPRPGRHRRGTTVRRAAQGTIQAIAQTGGRAHASAPRRFRARCTWR